MRPSVDFMTMMRYFSLSLNYLALIFIAQVAYAGTPGAQGSADSAAAVIKERAEVLAKKFEGLKKYLPRDASFENMNVLISTRFIKRSDYFASVENGVYDPSLIYRPAPVTWKNWFNTLKNDVLLRAVDRLPVTLNDLKRWNRLSLKGASPDFLAKGDFVTGVRYGKNTHRAEAITTQEMHNLNSFYFYGESKPGLRFIPLVCEEDLGQRKERPADTPECKSSIASANRYRSVSPYWTMVYQDIFIRHEYFFACAHRPSEAELAVMMNANKICGAIEYPTTDSLNERLDRILQKVNAFLRHKHSIYEIYSFAITAQRQLVALHPFSDGNGRTSRYLMDYITTAFGLTALQIQNMDLDLTTGFRDYRMRAFNATLQSLNLAGSCLTTWEKAIQSKSAASMNAAQNSICGFQF